MQRRQTTPSLARFSTAACLPNPKRDRQRLRFEPPSAAGLQKPPRRQHRQVTPRAEPEQPALPSRAKARPAAAAGSTLMSDRIRLVASGGESLHIGIRTEVGKAVLRRFGADAEFWDDKQCTVERRLDGQWIVTPAPGTVNETLINGTPVTTPRSLSDGDVLAAGRSAKGISKLPLTARAG